MLNRPLVSTSERTDKTCENLKVQVIKQMQQDADGKLYIQNKHLCFKYIGFLKVSFVSEKAGKGFLLS